MEGRGKVRASQSRSMWTLSPTVTASRWRATALGNRGVCVFYVSVCSSCCLSHKLAQGRILRGGGVLGRNSPRSGGGGVRVQVRGNFHMQCTNKQKQPPMGV